MAYPVVQSGTATTTTTASTNTVTMASTSTAGSALFVWGILWTSVAGASVTVAVSDDKSNTWVVDTTADPGGGATRKVFIASCMSAATGTQVITLTFTGGTSTSNTAYLEAANVTGRYLKFGRGSGGSNQTTPISVNNIATNNSAPALVLHTVSIGGFFANIGGSATGNTGTYTDLVLNNNSTGTTPSGLAGYWTASTRDQDIATDAWTSGATTLAQCIASYGYIPQCGSGWLKI